MVEGVDSHYVSCMVEGVDSHYVSFIVEAVDLCPIATVLLGFSKTNLLDEFCWYFERFLQTFEF